MSDDLLEQARQHVASFEAIGGTVAYPFSVRLAKRVISLSEASEHPSPNAREEALTDAIKLMDQIGCDWRDAGDMTKFYATNYLIEQVRALLSTS